MQPQTELITNIKNDIEKNFPSIGGVSLEELSDDGRMYIEIGAGTVDKKYIRGPVESMVPVLFMLKRPGSKEAKCLNDLSKVCNYYQKTRKPPAGESYKARNADIAAGPSKSARYEDGQVLYSCIINFKISY